METFPHYVIPLPEILDGRPSDIDPLLKDIAFQYNIRMDVWEILIGLFDPRTTALLFESGYTIISANLI